MLSFSIINNDNIPQWCNDLSSVLQKFKIKGTIFIAGKLAENYPDCISVFSANKDIDVGSSTYNYSNIASVPYSKALEEVEKGKVAIYNVNKLDSSLFKAPYGSTDENIYSILTRSGITADFSYPNQYNKYENGMFIKYDLTSYNGSNPSEEVKTDSSKGNPVAINFDNTIPINYIDGYISDIKSRIADVHFTNPSEITNLALTNRN
jgi:peptidoglycan/xylan/chitin deacetylase (PgdA/CDA1 family)